ncbi:MAG: hypothetical protein V4519_00510 [Patescibacteria group bacterium]
MSEKIPESNILRLPEDDEVIRSLYNLIGSKIHGREDLRTSQEKVTEAAYMTAIAEELVASKTVDYQALLEELKNRNGGESNTMNFDRAFATVKEIVENEELI